MARINEEPILRLLLQAPMTCEWLLAASASFPKPYRSLGRVREVMAALEREGLVRRVPLLELHQGQRRWLYHLAPSARRLLPELEGLRASSGVFHPPTDPRSHGLAVAKFVAHLHRSIGHSGGRAKLLVSLRDRAFWADVQLAGVSGKRQRQMVPDHTFLVEVDNAPQLLFLELQNRAALVVPASPQSATRSFRFKLARYKAFLRSFREHPLIAEMVRAHGPLPGFRTLVVTTRSEASQQNLVAAASDYSKLFYFTRIELARYGNLIFDPIWTLPSGSKRAIADAIGRDQS